LFAHGSVVKLPSVVHGSFPVFGPDCKTCISRYNLQEFPRDHARHHKPTRRRRGSLDAEWHVDRALPRVLARVLALDDFEEPAPPLFAEAHVRLRLGGAGRTRRLRANRAQYDEIELSPRVLVTCPGRTAKTALFGRAYGAPFGIAPMGGTSMAAFRGDVVLARAAAAAGVPMIMSGASLTRLEDVRSAGATAWFQAYLPGETGPITRLVERVARAGFDTLVLTVDVR